MIIRTEIPKNRSRLKAAALQRIPCDLTIKNVRLANVITGEIYDAEVDVLDGVIVRVRECGETTSMPSPTVYDGAGAYLIPGFIDTHMHVESTMMIPENLSRSIVQWGTTTICTDPHEIGNVVGVDGVRFMLENAKKSVLRQYVLAPSCVPAVPSLENAGASFGPQEVGEILDMPDVVGVAEIMDFVGVYNDSPRMHDIVEEGIRKKAFLQGHSPQLRGKELAAYILGGPSSCHESFSADEAREKLRNGMHINLRASSLIDTLSALVDGFRDQKWRDFVSICTDDVHAKDLLTVGHVNHVVGKAIAAGIDPIEAIKMATLNAAREYGFGDLGAIAPGYLADMQIVDELDGRRPTAVFISGKLVARNGEYLGNDRFIPEKNYPNAFQIEQITGPESFVMKAPDGCGEFVDVNIVVPLDNHRVLSKTEWVSLPVKDGLVSLDGRSDLQFICVCNRYGLPTKTVAIFKDFGLDHGAIATTISHDSHNLTIVYKDPRDAYAAAMELKSCGGGICVVENGKILATLALPVAGLMSTKTCSEIAAEIDAAQAAVDAVCFIPTALLQVVVLALPCLPGVVVTDLGIADGLSQQILPPFRV